MATRSTCVFALIVALGSVFLTVYWDGDRPVALRLLRATSLSAVLAAAAVLPIFWFYLGNYRWSGSWYLASPKMQIQGRPESTVWEVLSNEGYWLLMPTNLLGAHWNPPWRNHLWSLWLATLCAVAIIYLATRRGGWKNVLRLDRVALPWLVLMAHFAGLMFAQFTHKVGWGQLSFRYLFPALLSIGMFMAVPAVAWRKMSGVFVAGIGALMAFAGPMGLMAYLDRRYPQVAAGESSWNRLLAAVAGNGFTVDWLWITWSMVAAGLLVLLWAVPRAHVVDADSDVSRS